MLPLLFAALVDTVEAPLPDFDIVYVHEWGAVTFTEELVHFGTGPTSSPGTCIEIPEPDIWDEPVARAPVVYFYGAPFTGTFTVTVPHGDFIETVPEPQTPEDMIPVTPGAEGFSVAKWRIDSDPYLGREAFEEPGSGCIPGDLHELWRRPESSTLIFDDGSVESFIYYECTLDRTVCGEYWDKLRREGDPAENPDCTFPMMRFEVMDSRTVSMEVYGPGEDSGRSPVPDIVDRETVLETLCSWAGGSMKSEEISAMWDTWEDWISAGSWSGEVLLVFPLPADLVETMSVISLDTGENRMVEYSRFYIGVASL